jgi:hypothetical protein
MIDYDKFFTINDSVKGLKTISISLPTPPAANKIDGHEYPFYDQYFRYEVFPDKLTQLEKDIRKEFRAKAEAKREFVMTGQVVLQEMWKRMEANPDYYEKEFQWIKNQWYYRLYGYWFMNNGKATYIDGWHWFYLNYWYMGEEKGHPEYRDRDRRQFLFMRYIYTTKETFKYVNPKTFEAIPDENGDYEMIEMPGRTFYGVHQPKNRRGGNTNIGLCIEYEILSRSRGDVTGGNQSYTEEQIKGAWSKIMGAWDVMPFFFKPLWQGEERPQNKLVFVSDKIDNSLGSMINYALTGKETAYEGGTLLFKLDEEEGKTVNINIKYRWEVNQITLAKGSGSKIQGLSYHPSTVSEAHGEAAQVFMTMFEESNFFVRLSNGQTKSGLAGVYFPAWDCLHGHVDKYGYGIVDTPTEKQLRDGYKGIGARNFLQKKRDDLLMINTPSSLQKLRVERKEFPFDLSDIYLSSETSELDYNYDAIGRRMIEVSRMIPEPFEYYDLKWENGMKDGRVIEIRNPMGRFCISQVMGDKGNRKQQRRVFDTQTNRPKIIYSPAEVENVAGGDPFKYFKGNAADLKKRKRLYSDGGGAVRLINGRLICTYSARPLLQSDYLEDMLMMCVYFNAKMFPETNVDDLYKYFIDRGYDGYLLYEKDSGGKQKMKPGGFTSDKSITKLFELNKSYCEQFVEVECHMDFLKEMKEIKNTDDMTNHDLFTATAYCNWGNFVLNQRIVPNKSHRVYKRLFAPKSQ